MDLNLKRGSQEVFGKTNTNRKAEVHKAEMNRKGGSQEMPRTHAGDTQEVRI